MNEPTTETRPTPGALLARGAAPSLYSGTG